MTSPIPGSLGSCPRTILAIESSCDETGIGIAELAADGTVTLLAD